MQILYLSRWHPYPLTNGAKIRTFNLVRELARAHDVSLITFVEPTDRIDDASRHALSEICVRVRELPYRKFRPTSGRALAGLFSQAPRSLVDTYSPAFARAVDEHLATRETHLVVGATTWTLPYAARARAWPRWFEELELGQFHDPTRAPLLSRDGLRARLSWLKLTHYLRRILPGFATCTLVSAPERQLARTIAPEYGAFSVLPNAVDAASYAGDFGAPEPASLVLAGSLTYHPNYEGADWLLTQVYPALLTEYPDLRLRITGSTAGADLSALPRRPGLEITGLLPDIQPTIARSTVSVVPLRSGGGTRLKIIESMALGTPVVSTTKGAEGLDVTHGENILLADTPAQFAACVRSVLAEPALRARLAEGGRALVRTHYDWRVVGEAARQIAERAADTPVAGPRARAMAGTGGRR